MMSSCKKHQVNYMIATWRMMRLLVHFIYCLVFVLFFIQYKDDAGKANSLKAWAIKLLNILDITLQIPCDFPQQLKNTLLVANHISWLDILIVFTVVNPRFVAKKEISSWPIIGWLTKQGDTIFIDRENKRTIRKVNESLANELSKGNCIAVFPEGTTSDGQSILPFKASLFEPILQSKGNVLPVVIQYKDGEGNRSLRPAFTGDLSLLASVWRVLTSHRLHVVVHYQEPLNAEHYTDRMALANESYRLVTACLQYHSTNNSN